MVTPVHDDQLSSLLLGMRGIDGRRFWGAESVQYIRRPLLRRVPDVLLREGPDCRLFSVYPPLWHHLVVRQCVDGQVGRHFNEVDAAVALGFARRPSERVERAIHWFLLELAQEGHLDVVGAHTYRVIADFFEPPASRVRQQTLRLFEFDTEHTSR